MNDPALQCQECAHVYTLTRKIPWCDCGGLFDLRFTPGNFDIEASDFTMWRYRGILPISTAVSLGEPITPIIQIPLGHPKVFAKLDYLMPTGSFKDRGAAILVSAMKEIGIRHFMEDSSGNAGAAISAYAARAGLRCDIYCPSSASPGKLRQIERTGAVINRIDGPRDQTTAALMGRAGEIFYASHNWHPLFLHGVKTMAYEIAEQFAWDVPDHVLAPTGGGAVLLGLNLGFSELVRLGRIRAVPRLHAVQAEACAPLVHDPLVPGTSIAEGILTSKPPRLSMLKRVVDRVAVVSEKEIVDGFQALTRMGIHSEPTSAVVIPGFKKLSISDRESVLLILTGSGLKVPL